MVKENIIMQTTAIGSDDGKNTYEIHRKWQENGKKSLVICLYPTISVDNAGKLDLSTMHLLNHVNELGWSEMSIVNLYSTVFDEKPTVSQLNEDSNNMAYIEEFLERKDIKEYDIVIAWGSSLSTHKLTINLKMDVVSMLLDKGLEDNVKCIVTENLVVRSEHGTHPLYLGLHFSRDKWELQEISLKNILNELKKAIQPVTIVEKPKKGGKKNVPKVNE